MALINNIEQEELLKYRVVEYSSFKKNYTPDNIHKDHSEDEKSRWTSFNSEGEQYLLLELDRKCMLKTVLFGKYSKPHACNISDFKVFVGLNKIDMKVVISAGLQNNPKHESFVVNGIYKGKGELCQYVKIVPLKTHGGRFSFSVWYLELWGIVNEVEIKQIEKDMKLEKETAITFNVLKQLRKENHHDLADEYAKRKGINSINEHSANLYKSIIMKKDLDSAENILLRMEKENSSIFEKAYEDFAKKSGVDAIWKRLESENGPPARGGHQFVLDSNRGNLILFGGWDGKKALSDLWKYIPLENKWEQILDNQADNVFPLPVSCHRMAYDSDKDGVYVLGGYKNDNYSPGYKQLYFLDLKTNKWSVLSDNTASEGGPRSIYNHTMVYDSVTKQLIVFGGRINKDANDKRIEYSGLFYYCTVLMKWQEYKSKFPHKQKILPRTNHSMYIDNNKRRLYIYGGQRKSRSMSDLYSINIRTGEVEEYFYRSESIGGPLAGSLINCPSVSGNGEMVFYSSSVISEFKKDEYSLLFKPERGFTKPKEQMSDFDILENNCIFIWKEGVWKKTNKKRGEKMNSQKGIIQTPSSRYGFQFVYDGVGGYYLYGGKPIEEDLDDDRRLDDLWRVVLVEKPREYFLKKLLLAVKGAKFKKLIMNNNGLEAHRYLKKEIRPLCDSSTEEGKEFIQELGTLLFSDKGNSISLEEKDINMECFENIGALFGSSF
eukprot:GHVP01060924.1.p1 GENE.GHVP01060924.1~~GHVP01060924.1.p1  ORF type:complete len:719 (+),score=135.08 GHVP01060924.1:149-2305(+)